MSWSNVRIKELLPSLEEDFINNKIEATFGEFFGTKLFITQQNLLYLNGGNVNKCQPASPQCGWFGGKHFNIHTGEKFVGALSSLFC